VPAIDLPAPQDGGEQRQQADRFDKLVEMNIQGPDQGNAGKRGEQQRAGDPVPFEIPEHQRQGYDSKQRYGDCLQMRIDRDGNADHGEDADEKDGAITGKEGQHGEYQREPGAPGSRFAGITRLIVHGLFY